MEEKPKRLNIVIKCYGCGKEIKPNSQYYYLDGQETICKKCWYKDKK